MNKELKDGLKEVIQMGTKEAYSISEALKMDYEKYKISGRGYGLATYRGKILCTDLDESEDISLFENLLKQIDEVNEMYDKSC